MHYSHDKTKIHITHSTPWVVYSLQEKIVLVILIDKFNDNINFKGS